jgi:asparagine synthase (glutamine-hydrolysing)
MCGIAGVLTFSNSRFRVSESYLASMQDTMAHRGPDGRGIWISPDRRVGLGHRRLSIIDLSDAAAQPMSNQAKTVWLTFNGEIYNHAEIRAELVALGDGAWKTDHSDTEVIIHAYERWGHECLKRFRGMFAFALWDERARELWLVRDRLGIKPLYYSVHHGRITFASEIKALLPDPDQKRTVSEEALYHYLSFLTTPAPQTLFEGIRKLECGTWIRVGDNGRISEHRYWDVWDHVDPLTNLSEEDTCERIREELRKAVKLRKVSDVPVGVFLSGGIDSSTNAVLFSEGESESIKTFSIGYDQEYRSYPSELCYARSVAKLVNAQHYERILSQNDLIDFLPTMVHLQDEPIGDPVCVPVYYVSKLARENGVVVCQLGEGADELFWGYFHWKIKLRLAELNQLPVPNGIKRVGLAGLKLFGQDDSLAYEALRRGAIGLPVFWSGAEAFTETQKQAILSPRLRRKFSNFTSWEALRPTWQRFKEKAWDQSILHWMTYSDLNLRLPELLLMRVDKMSMGVSVEARVPFLDHKFVELTMSIPAANKTKNSEQKYLLKNSVRGLIPDEIINRKKQGFGVPVYEWFSRELGAYARERVNSFCAETDFLDPTEVHRVFDSRQHELSWYLLNLALWWQEYVGAPRPEEMAVVS